MNCEVFFFYQFQEEPRIQQTFNKLSQERINQAINSYDLKRCIEIDGKSVEINYA